MKKTFRYIFLTKGKVALVDWEDYDLCAASRWYAVAMNKGKLHYAYRTHRDDEGPVQMHRLISGAREQWQVVDHINHDTLDNRRCNLRITTHQMNSVHRRKDESFLHSKFKGVGKKNRGKTQRWCAQLTMHGYQIHLGYFGTEEEAARAYDVAAGKFFGEFACLNFP